MGRRTETMDRDAQMYLLHKQNVPHSLIAQQFGVSIATVGTGVRRAIQDSFRLSAEEDRMVMSDQIDDLMFRLRRILSKEVYLIGVNGKVAVDPRTGEPLIDWAHQRQTIALLGKFMDQKAKLLGLNQPVKHRVEVTDKMDEQIEQMLAALIANGALPEGMGRPVIEAEVIELPVGAGDGDGSGEDDG